MGDSRPGNGGGWPFEEGGDGLPGLPPEWGTVLIPDDASELDHEAFALRREIRRDARRGRERRVLGLRVRRAHRPSTHFSRRDPTEPTLAVPVVIMAVAVLTTLISLFVVTWGRGSSPPTVTGDPTATVAGATTSANLADTVVKNEAGQPVRIGTLTPAIVLLLDSCQCPDLVRDVAALAPTGVRVLAIGTTAPSVPDRPANVIALADPDGRLKARNSTAAGSTSSGATALVVNRAGAVTLTVGGVATVKDLPAIDDSRFS